MSILPVETLVHEMVGSGFPVALQGKRTSPSASTETLAEFNTVIRGFIPPAPASNSHGLGGARVGCRELIRPAADTLKNVLNTDQIILNSRNDVTYK